MKDRKEQATILTTFHRLLDEAVQKLPPGRARETLKLQRNHIASQIDALGDGDLDGGLIPSGAYEETQDAPPWTLFGLPEGMPRVDLDPTQEEELLESILPTGVPAVELHPPVDPGPELRECWRRSQAARRSLARRNNHWWQNWGKHYGYVCQEMFFPLSVDEIAAAIRITERDGGPLRAIGGGWSFSDVALPGDLMGPTSSPPVARRPTDPLPLKPRSPGAALGVEALTKIVPLAETFSTDPSVPTIAEIARPAGTPPDGAGSLVLFSSELNGPDPRWTYLGGGGWNVSAADITNLFRDGYRPVRSPGPDDAGSLAMFDYTTGSFLPHTFYYGNGRWISGVFGSRATVINSAELLPGLPPTVRPRASNAAFSMSLLATPLSAYLINTESMASSLQQNLPNLLSEEARRETDPANPNRKYYFHVEAGIKMSDLSKLLQHQSPRLAIEASGGSPGATLAGVLATATHGGEHTTPLLVDRVKAVHLVGPGGVQWWIEGYYPVADPDKLMEMYPCLTRDHIIAGRNPVHGILPQDWLNAVVVSMGCMGVVYSVVLEVVPIYGLHEVVIETTWREVLKKAFYYPTEPGEYGPRGNVNLSVDELRHPPSLAEDRAKLGRSLKNLFANGSLTEIARNNRYVDIAIDPNPIVSYVYHKRDWNCWVINREVTQAIPFDPKPSPKDLIGRISKSIEKRLGPDEVSRRLAELHNYESIRRIVRQFEHGDIPNIILEIMRQLSELPDEIGSALSKLERLTDSADAINTILDLLTAPFEASTDDYYKSADFKAASAIVSGLFSGLFGVEDGRGESTDIVTRVGEIGFPASGIMGAAIEIAMAPDDAFTFLQNEILDRIERPFFGYVSIRFCPQTQTLLGMQQYSPSIMIEVVAFGTQSARDFVADLEQRTVDLIRGGLDAMLHWGFVSEQLDDSTLRAIPAINTGSPTKLQKFITVRSLIRAAGPEGENVFDNAFTRRLDL